MLQMKHAGRGFRCHDGRWESRNRLRYDRTHDKADAVAELRAQGQSLWLDNIHRRLIMSVELTRLPDAGITRVTSNPTIFEKVVSGSSDYDEALRHIAQEGLEPGDILWELMVADIQAAADVFSPVYERTGGQDGYVSIEVAPEVAGSTPRTIAMAEDLRRRCDRPNVMVKIPATPAGDPRDPRQGRAGPQHQRHADLLRGPVC